MYTQRENKKKSLCEWQRTDERHKIVFMCALQLNSRDESCYFARRPLFGNDIVCAHDAPQFSYLQYYEEILWCGNEVTFRMRTAQRQRQRLESVLS